MHGFSEKDELAHCVYNVHIVSYTFEYLDTSFEFINEYFDVG